jgi:hypothetical protein
MDQRTDSPRIAGAYSLRKRAATPDGKFGLYAAFIHDGEVGDSGGYEFGKRK